MTELKISVLGGFSVRTGSDAVSLRSRRTEALFAYLLLTGEPHSREHLGDLLWDTGNPTRAAGNLRVLLTNLRRSLGECVEISRATVQFRPPPDWAVVTDLEDFRAGAAGPLRTPVADLGDHDLEALDAASTLARGALLERLEVPGCPRFDDWLSAERAAVDRERLAVQRHLVEGLLAHARHEPAIASATRWKALEPLAEGPRAALVRARIAAGEVAGARHEYELLESMLHAEMDEAPSREIRTVLERAERRLAGPGAPRTQHRTPSRGKRTEPRARAPWSRFVGRQTELATIVQGYTEVLQGRGAVVVLQGGPGSGKSMLLRQATQLLLRQDRSVAVLGASCGSFPVDGPASSLYAAHVLGQLDGDTSGPWLGASMPMSVAARLAELDVLSSSGAADLAAPAARLVSAVRHLSTTRPVVLVADDLQWGDDVTLQALADLTQDLRTRPVLLLLASRPDPLAVRSHRLLARISRGRSDVRIDLDHDPAGAARPFVEALLASEPHDLPDTFVQQLIDLGGGHPQTTVELLRDMARRRVLDEGPDGRYLLANPGDVRVPERVGRLLDEQLHDLPEEHAGVVEAAAVCGAEFDVRVVAALCDRPLEDVIRVVAGRPGVASPLFAPAWEDHEGGSSTHRFRHPLMHQHVRTGMDQVWLEHLGQARLGLDSTRESARWIRRRAANAGPHPTQ